MLVNYTYAASAGNLPKRRWARRVFSFALGYTVLRARRFFQGDSCKVISGDFEFFSLSTGSREKGIRVVVKFSI